MGSTGAGGCGGASCVCGPAGLTDGGRPEGVSGGINGGTNGGDGSRGVACVGRTSRRRLAILPAAAMPQPRALPRLATEGGAVGGGHAW